MPKLTKTALRRKPPVTDELLIPASDADAERLLDTQSALDNARQGLALAQVAGESDEAAAHARVFNAKTALTAVQDEIRKTGLSIVLVCAGQSRFNEVMLECPPTEVQKEEAEKAGDQEPTYDPAAFWPAIVAASVPDSDLTPDDWRREVFESKLWGPGELKELRDRTFNLYQRSRIVELGN